MNTNRNNEIKSKIDKNGSLINYKQSTSYTCGACCIMTAYHEFYMTGLSKEREMLIWRYISNPVKWLGSFPAEIISFLMVRDKYAVFYFPRKFNFKKINIILRPVYIILIKSHEFFAINKLINKGYPVYKFNNNEIDLERLLSIIQNNPDVRIIFTVVLNSLELHYIMIKDYNGMVYVMDSQKDEGLLISKDEFIDNYSPVDFGCYFVFKK